MNQASNLCFVADSTLGRLARWLRLAGFDTVYDPNPPEYKRLLTLSTGRCFILTRSRYVHRQLAGRDVIFIHSNNISDQMDQIIHELHLKPNDFHSFTRCSMCNKPLHDASQTEASGRVPEYILQSHTRFHRCLKCGRFYWPGSHFKRWTIQMNRWFEKNNHETDSGKIPK
jgi:uncharacterized protein with PIN domain